MKLADLINIIDQAQYLKHILEGGYEDDHDTVLARIRGLDNDDFERFVEQVEKLAGGVIALKNYDV